MCQNMEKMKRRMLRRRSCFVQVEVWAMLEEVQDTLRTTLFYRRKGIVAVRKVKVFHKIRSRTFQGSSLQIEEIQRWS